MDTIVTLASCPGTLMAYIPMPCNCTFTLKIIIVKYNTGICYLHVLHNVADCKLTTVSLPSLHWCKSQRDNNAHIFLNALVYITIDKINGDD